MVGSEVSVFVCAAGALAYTRLKYDGQQFPVGGNWKIRILIAWATVFNSIIHSLDICANWVSESNDWIVCFNVAYAFQLDPHIQCVYYGVLRTHKNTRRDRNDCRMNVFVYFGDLAIWQTKMRIQKIQQQHKQYEKKRKHHTSSVNSTRFESMQKTKITNNYK